MTENVNRSVFTHLHVNRWRQLGRIELEFHPRLTVLTGANASGKSTLLSILATHFEWSRQFSSSPSSDKSNRWLNVDSETVIIPQLNTKMHEIGKLIYGSGNETKVLVPPHDSTERSSYDIYLPTREAVAGVFLNSHRQTTGGYAHVESIPTTFADPDTLLRQYEDVLRNRITGGYTPKTPQVIFKESLMSAAVFGGRGNSALVPNEEATAIWEGYQEVLAEVLPKSLKFIRLMIRNPDVVIETGSGSFILDDASGGLVALMEMTWQIFLRSRRHSSFCVLLDEPENHLHPSLQREIIPSLLRAFADVQFIVATHSPFVVTASPNSHVYVLDYNDEGHVDSAKLDTVSKASGADETLQRVLGLPSTFPIWAENAFHEIVDKRVLSGMTPKDLEELRAELQRKGLVSSFPSAIARIVDGNKS